MNPAFSSLLAALARELDLPGIETRDDDPSCLLGIDDFELPLYGPGHDLHRGGPPARAQA